MIGSEGETYSGTQTRSYHEEYVRLYILIFVGLYSPNFQKWSLCLYILLSFNLFSIRLSIIILSNSLK